MLYKFIWAINCFGCCGRRSPEAVETIPLEEISSSNNTANYGLTSDKYNWLEKYTDTKFVDINPGVRVETTQNQNFNAEITRIDPKAGPPELRFKIEFYPKKWVLKEEYRRNFNGVYASDITSYQYIKTRNAYPGILETSPTEIELSEVVNRETLEYVDEHSSLLKTNNHDFYTGFKNTPYGKRVTYLLDNFGFIPTRINIQNIDDEILILKTNIYISIDKKTH